MYQPESEAEALEIYRKLTLIRQCQEAICKEYTTDAIKTPVHLGIGLEGISVGVTHNLPPNTKVFGPMRTHGLYLALADETDAYFAELYGKSTGTGGGKAGSMHLSDPKAGLVATSGIVASTVPLAVGAALANKIKGNDDLVIVTFGDSVLEAGEFWESLNFACLHALNILFVCEDNGLAAQTPKSERHGFELGYRTVDGFKCHGSQVDGSDVLKVIGDTQHLIDCIYGRISLRSGWGLGYALKQPAFLHATYTRFLEHVGPNTDWDKGYRKEPVGKLDPVAKYEDWLDYGWYKLRPIYYEVQEQIAFSIEKAKSDPYPNAQDLLYGVYAKWSTN